MSIKLHNGQWYVEVDRIAHQTRDGRSTTLIKWRSQCADCAGWFTFTAPAFAPKFVPNRRCQKHKRPGCRVNGGAA